MVNVSRLRKTQIHWIFSLLFFTALAIFIYRTPILNIGPHVFELVVDLEVPISLNNLIHYYYPIWNDVLSFVDLVAAFQVGVWLFLGLAWILQLSSMTTVLLMFVASTALAGFAGYACTYTLIRRSYSGSDQIPIIIASLAAGLVTIINPLWANDATHVAKKLAFVFAPVTFLLFWLGFREKRFSYVLGGTIAMVFYTTGPRNLISATILFLLIAVFSLAEDIIRSRFNLKTSLRSLLLYVKYGCFAVLAYIALDAYRLVPLLYRYATSGQQAPYLATLESALQGDEGSTLVGVIQFNPIQPNLHRGYLNVPAVLQGTPTTQFIFYSGFIVFACIIILAFVRPLNRDIVFLIVNFVFWTIISTALNPLGFPYVEELYYWLIFEAPLHQYMFWAYRHAIEFWSLSLVTGAFLFGIFLFSVLTTQKVSALPPKKKLLGIVLVVMVLGAVLLPSWPMFTGDFGGVLEPLKVPDEYFTLNQWFSEQPGDFKILWLPFYNPGSIGRWSSVPWIARQTTPILASVEGIQWFDMLSSAKATYGVYITTTNRGIPVESYLENLLSTDEIYPFDVLQANRTDHLGKLLAPLNIRYLVLDTAMQASVITTNVILNVLEHQKDLRLVRKEGFFYVFENMKYAPHIYSASNGILVDGGRETLTSLSSFDFFNSTAAPLFFLDEGTIWDQAVFTYSDLILLRDWRNLLPIVDSSDVSAPLTYAIHDPTFFHSFWSKAMATNPRYGLWTPILDSANVPNWDYDYGLGFVFTSRPNLGFSFPVKVGKDGNYYGYLRYMPSRSGGRFQVLIDGVEVATISSLSNVTGSIVADLGLQYLTEGTHNVTLLNLEGFNAINYVMLIPQDKLAIDQQKILDILGNKALVYLELPGITLDLSNATITSEYGGAAMNGWAINYGPHGSSWTYLDLVTPGQYRVAVSDPVPQPGAVLVQIANYTFPMIFSSTSPRLTYTPPVYLGQKKYSLIISRLWGNPIVDGAFVYSAEGNATLDSLFERNPSTNVFSFTKISPTKIIVQLNAMQPLWLMMAESWDPDWVLSYDGHTAHPSLTYSSINSYHINTDGATQVTLEYDLQRLFDIGSAISLASFVAAILIIYLDRRKLRGSKGRGESAAMQIASDCQELF